MENHERWANEVGSKAWKLDYSYTTKDIKHLIDCAYKLVKLMQAVGYSSQDIAMIFGLQHVKYGKKERILLDALKHGEVSPSDSLSEIKEKLDPVYKISRQSWNIALKRLVENGDLALWKV